MPCHVSEKGKHHYQLSNIELSQQAYKNCFISLIDVCLSMDDHSLYVLYCFVIFMCFIYFYDFHLSLSNSVRITLIKRLLDLYTTKIMVSATIGVTIDEYGDTDGCIL